MQLNTEKDRSLEYEAALLYLKRATGVEPATFSLEGWWSHNVVYRYPQDYAP